MSGTSYIPVKLRTTLRNYIFIGVTGKDEYDNDDYVQLVIDLAAGFPIDETMLAGGKHWLTIPVVARE